MKCLDRRYWCRTYSSILFLGCPIDLSLVDKKRLKNHSSSSGELALPSDNKESEDDDYYDDDDEDEKFTFVEKFVKEKYSSHFYLGQAVVAPDLSEWHDRNEVFLAIRLPGDDLTIPKLTRFFTNFDSGVLDQFRTLMNLLGQPEEESEPELCSCQYNIG